MAYVEYDCTEHVAVIRLNRPDRLNALSPELFDELRGVFARFVRDDDAWVGILTGTGRGFCAGRDLKAQASGGSPPEPKYTPDWNIFGVPDTDKPLIAAVNGFAIGAGWYMTAGCDIRVAAESAQFGMGEIPTGVLGPYWFPGAEVLPWALAAEFTLIGDRVPAQRLLQLGLLNEVVPDDALMDTAWKWARKFLALPPLHVRRTKALMASMRRTPNEGLVAREMEARRFLNGLDDTREAAQAFAEKRMPEFTGK
ncbi:MAG TPA: enoyl-CoA hydratase-related protein [Tepidiformaceae bacterium]|nr:enoyl-CoA hydratase-related protein [Tepidiformaceae bacterium]